MTFSNIKLVSLLTLVLGLMTITAKANVCLNTNDNDLVTPNVEIFVEAIISGDVKQIREQIDRGIDVNQFDSGVHTLFLASAYGTKEILEILHRAGIDRKPISKAIQDKTNNSTQGSPLVIAAYYGKIEILEVLLDLYKLDIHDMERTDSEEFGWTPLNAAAWNNQTNTVKYLISRGANGNLVDGTDHNALETAIGNNAIDVQNYLSSIGYTEVEIEYPNDVFSKIFESGNEYYLNEKRDQGIKSSGPYYVYHKRTLDLSSFTNYVLRYDFKVERLETDSNVMIAFDSYGSMPMPLSLGLGDYSVIIHQNKDIRTIQIYYENRLIRNDDLTTDHDNAISDRDDINGYDTFGFIRIQDCDIIIKNYSVEGNIK